ncbi:hypothetical protein [Oceanivirga miroungae]|uniref:Lipoprotein n=1 Tax=Oceanivirga miroungae TaxID=1130046 RepID=A0A6I8MD63_9FUSO|nr:hypothetical protein [Oceanivirga miroungae]VWL85093.1 hypothetical protein OMES3154_00375 [Oceanivirga miroungae]
MRYTKRILSILFTLIFAISCVNSNVQLDFVEPNKGTSNIEFKISKEIISKEKFDNTVKNAISLLKSQNIEASYKYNGIVKDNLLNETYEAHSYGIDLKFNSIEELKKAFSIFDDTIEVNVNRMNESNVYEIEILNSEFVEYSIKVNGQILTINDKTANEKTNEVVFKDHQKRYSLTYEYAKTSIFMIILIVLLVLAIILFALFAIFNRKYNLVDKVKGLKKEKTNDDKEIESEEDIIITD